MGRTWHPEHFVCTHCQEEIGSRNFFEREGQPYCEKDYHNLFSPRCYYCNGPILDVSHCRCLESVVITANKRKDRQVKSVKPRNQLDLVCKSESVLKVFSVK